MKLHQTWRVAVLMGGLNREREVSLKSGKAVAAALRDAGHEVTDYDVTDPALPGLREARPDACFVALHGPFGEDGTVQELLEKMGLPYTGSGPAASRLGMNKMASKRLFIRHSVPTADYFAVDASHSVAWAERQAEQFGYPLVCKPAASGSSLGISIVKDPAGLPDAIALAREEGDVVLVERYARGREFTIGVLQGEGLPMIELVPSRQFFDYEAKYSDERTRYITPVSLLPTLYRKCSEAAVRAYGALGCRHMARVDMIYGYDANLYVLELNTIPGFTPRSLLPMAAAEAGVPFPALCDRLVRAAVRDAAETGKRRRLIA